MPAQIIELPIDVFEGLLHSDGEIALRLGEATELSCDIEAPRDGAPTMVVRGYPDVHGLGHRTLNLDGVLVLALVPHGGIPACWPRPLPDPVTLRLLDLVEAVLADIDALTGHQRFALADAFERARQAPAIGLRPVVPLRPRSARQRRWRRVGLELSARLAEPLQALDRKLASYRTSLIASDLESVIVGLSCWSELGTKLYVRPRSEDGAPWAGLLAESCRGDLRETMEAATVLADTTIAMLTMFDPHAVPFRPWITADDLLLANAFIVDSPFHTLRTQCLRAEADAQVPPVGIARALEEWCHDMRPGVWTGVHPLVHAAMAFRELLRLRPFTAANGRVARIVLQVLLHRAGWSALPWEAAFEILAHEDQRAFGTLCCKDSYTAFMQALLRRAELAVTLGTAMIEALVPIREDLVVGFSAETRADGRARRFAGDLLRGPLALGLFDCSRERRRKELQALVDAGKVDRVWSPFGTTYSVPAVRKLLRNLSHMARRKQAS